MARFYGEVYSPRSNATRCGSREIAGHIRGWNVGARVELWPRTATVNDARDKQDNNDDGIPKIHRIGAADWCSITATHGSNGSLHGHEVARLTDLPGGRVRVEVFNGRGKIAARYVLPGLRRHQ